MNQSTKLAETATGSLSTCRAFERLKIDHWCRGKALPCGRCRPFRLKAATANAEE